MNGARASVHILVVEDDPDLAEGAVTVIEKLGATVTLARDGTHGAECIATTRFDLVLLDIGLPGIDGLRLLEQIRDERSDTPVILLTARDGVDDRIRGLDRGADDYLVKPISLDELAARIRARLRGARLAMTDVVRVGVLKLDARARRAYVGDHALELPAREWTLLECLARRVEHVVSKELLQQQLTGDEDSNYNAVEVYVSRLRARLSPFGLRIRTIRGLGYRLDVTTGDTTVSPSRN